MKTLTWDETRQALLRGKDNTEVRTGEEANFPDQETGDSEILSAVRFNSTPRKFRMKTNIPTPK